MNVEETKEAIHVMKAFVDGKDLEVLGPVGKWEPLYFPRWGWDDTQYRIKPIATIRPWTADEVPLGAWLRTTGYNHNNRRTLICATYDESTRSLWFSESEHSIDNGKTWLPCGVMEESK